MTCAAIPGDTVEERAAVVLPYVQKYRQEIGVGEALAIGEHESVKFTKFFGPNGTKACSGVGRAVGVWQIMQPCYSSYPPVTNDDDACDLDKSTQAVMTRLMTNHQDMISRAPEAAQDKALHAYLLYVSHHAGRGGMDNLISKAIQQNGQPLTVDAVNSVANSSYADGYKEVSDRALYWDSHFANASSSSDWGVPMMVTLGVCAALALGAVVYLESTGSRSRWIHWSPARAA